MVWVTRAKNWFAEHPVGISIVGLVAVLTGALTIWQYFSKDPPIPKIIAIVREAGLMPSLLQLLALIVLLVGVGLQIAVLVVVRSRGNRLKIGARGLRSLAKGTRESEERLRELEMEYRELEQQRWVSRDLTHSSRRLPPRQVGQPQRIEVSIQSRVKIPAPIRLRVWFSEPVTEPWVSFDPPPDDDSHKSSLPRFVAPDEATVHGDGRAVDINWGPAMFDRDVLSGDAKIRLVANATTDGRFPEVIDVQRRYFLS